MYLAKVNFYAKIKEKDGVFYLKKSKNSCAVIVIDIDDFKVINDRYGHMIGDNVLVCAAQAIRNQFRSQDIVGRIGGDEFLVLMDYVLVMCHKRFYNTPI